LRRKKAKNFGDATNFGKGFWKTMKEIFAKKKMETKTTKTGTRILKPNFGINFGGKFLRKLLSVKLLGEILVLEAGIK